jgi:hypothetical protein
MRILVQGGERAVESDPLLAKSVPAILLNYSTRPFMNSKRKVPKILPVSMQFLYGLRSLRKIRFAVPRDNV